MYSTLKTILEEPLVALYVTELQVHGWRNHWVCGLGSVYRLLTNSQLPYGKEDRELFKQAIESYFSPDTVGDWERELDFGSERVIVLLLITLLRDIKTLTIRGRTSFSQLLESMRISNTSIMSRLTVVNIRPHRGDGGKLRMLVFFASLPSVTTINAAGMKICDKVSNFENLEHRSSNVHFLTFSESTIKPDALSVLLLQFKSLKRLSYDDSGWEHASVLNFEDLCTVISLHAAHSLGHLELTTFKPKYSVYSLRNMKVLKTLRMKFDHFLKDQRSISKTLASSLPKSIETLDLASGGSFTFSEWTFVLSELLSESTKGRLRNFKSLGVPVVERSRIELRYHEFPSQTLYRVYSTYSSVVSSFKKSYNEAGIELHVRST